MTEVFLTLPMDSFTAACRVQQRQADNTGRQQFSVVSTVTSRRAIQKDETFIPRGTSEADLDELFPKREP